MGPLSRSKITAPLPVVRSPIDIDAGLPKNLRGSGHRSLNG